MCVKYTYLVGSIFVGILFCLSSLASECHHQVFFSTPPPHPAEEDSPNKGDNDLNTNKRENQHLSMSMSMSMSSIISSPARGIKRSPIHP